MLSIAIALVLAAHSPDGQSGGNALGLSRATHEQRGAASLEESAREGNVKAMRDFGLALWKGQGVRRDREAAVSWFYEAALRNDAASMFILGRAFERGEGVGKDLKLADYWTTRAVEHGYRIEESR